MKIASALTMILALAPVAAGAADKTPEATIRALFAADKGYIDGKSEGVMGDKRALARFLSHALLRVIDADEAAAAKRKEPPTIEGDPFIDQQEADIKDIKISTVSASAERANVRADIAHGDGSREAITYILTLERGLWRIDDIDYARADGEQTLRGELAGK